MSSYPPACLMIYIFHTMHSVACEVADKARACFTGEKYKGGERKGMILLYNIYVLP